MIDIQNKYDCCGCNACVQSCPKNCISTHEDEEGFLYPKADASLCIECGLCEKVCPVINQASMREPLEAFAAKNPDEQIRRESSSGGIFTLLAEQTIEKGGVVFGAAFNDRWEVEHQWRNTKEGLSDFRGSKYVQSCIGNSFAQAESFLRQGREVLFCGTPCQIAGFRLFLRKDYDNLITVDFICHGVPSPGIFRQYLNEEKLLFSRKHNKAPTSVSDSTDAPKVNAIFFRDKVKGWKEFSLTLHFSQTSRKGELLSISKSSTLHKNPYLRGFLSNLYLRPSCHSCPAKELKSGSDITIADYWFIQELLPEIDDDKGISAVIINTAKGQEHFMSTKAQVYSSTFEDIKKRNRSVFMSASPSPNRTLFFTPTNESFSKKTQRLCKISFLQRIRTKFSAIKRKLL